MTTQELAADIYARILQDRILPGGPSAWTVDSKEAIAIAAACLEAADIFAEQALSWPSTPLYKEPPPP
jgi:hypothetical protein